MNESSPPWSQLWIGARLATMVPGRPYGAIEDAAIAMADGLLTFVGPATELPGPPATLAARVHSASGRWITPGLIDCHTHLVYGGNRAREFELRLEGASYEEIARAGGGILSTVRSTRAASSNELFDGAAHRLEPLLAEGVTMIEIKSGYGLELDTERRMLEVARRLAETHPLTVSTSFLGAHAVPPEYADDADGYVEEICSTMLPAIHDAGLADAVDGFCEGIAFSVPQMERIFAVANRLGLPVKLHAEQLSELGGAELVGRFGGLSADHLEHLSQRGVDALAASSAVAVLLPGAFYFLRETKVPPVDLLRKATVPIAVATDSNPGSSPVTSLLLMLNMACTLFRLTPEEALAGVTRNAAKALASGATHGTLQVGKAADFVVWEIDEPAELAYRIGSNPCHTVVRRGEIVRSRAA